MMIGIGPPVIASVGAGVKLRLPTTDETDALSVTVSVLPTPCALTPGLAVMLIGTVTDNWPADTVAVPWILTTVPTPLPVRDKVTTVAAIGG